MIMSPRSTPMRLLFLFLMQLAVLLALAGTARASTTPTVLIVGDSISAAYGMSLEQGWVALLERRLQEQYPNIAVVNASISGETSAGGLRRLPGLLQQHKPDLLIIELGGNDGLRGFPLNLFRKNLIDMIEMAWRHDARTLLLPMEIPPNYGMRYTQGFRETFQEAAGTADAILGPFILDGIATEPELMQADGIHPTAQAQIAMLNNVYRAVEDALQSDD